MNLNPPIVIYRNGIQPHSWARWMVMRTTRRNQNNLVSIVGKTGSGKTLSAISICEIMSKMDGVPFDVEDHVVFTLEDLMKLINSGKIKKGSKIVCDEFQCSISARDFQSKANKIFNYLLTTFRHLNLSLFFCTPFETLLDKNTRKLFHAKFETMSINRKDQTCKLKPRYVEYGDYKADPYRKQLIMRFKDSKGKNKSSKIFSWSVPRPSKEAEEAYEKKKLEFTSNLNKNIEAELTNFNQSGRSITSGRAKFLQGRKPLTDRQKQVMELLGKGNSQKEVATLLAVDVTVVSRHKVASEKKGYTVDEFKNKENV